VAVAQPSWLCGQLANLARYVSWATRQYVLSAHRLIAASSSRRGLQRRVISDR